VLGSLRKLLADYPAALMDEASEVGWALPETDMKGPAVLALQSASGAHVGWLEVLQPVASEDDDVAPIGVDALSRDLDELLHANALSQAIAPAGDRWRGVLRFDARLVHARRLHGELVAVARAAAEGREGVNLQSLGQICLWDLRRRMPHVHWHESLDPPIVIHAVRHQLRALIDRIATAAGDHAGPGGHVLLFAQQSNTADKAFIAAWASGEHEPALVDLPSGPPLAQAVALGHGGALEVAQAFDRRTLSDLRGLRIPGPSKGALFAAELAGATRDR